MATTAKTFSLSMENVIWLEKRAKEDSRSLSSFLNVALTKMKEAEEAQK